MMTIAITPYSQLKKDTILIGVNCITEKNAQQIVEKGLQIINPYQSHDDISKAAKYCWNVSLDCCNYLVKLLNQIHGVCYSQSYWKVLLLPWITAFVENLYDRYLRLCLVRENFPKAVVEIPQIERFSPLYKKSSDVCGQAHFHSTNIKIYFLLIKLMELDFHVKYLDANLVETIQPYTSSILKQIVKKIFRVGSICRPDNSLLWNLDKTGLTALDLAQRPGFFKWRIPYLKDDGFSKQAIDRRKITFESAENEFEDILHEFVRWAIPVAFFEEYRDRCDTARMLLRRKGVVTQNISSTYLSNDTIKFLLAEIRENGGKIKGHQHGGGYGQYTVAVIEKAEREIFDYFITWGWKDKDSCPTISLPDPRLSTLANTHRKKSSDILFIGNSGPMYMFRYQTYLIPEYVYFKHYPMKAIFFQNLKEFVKKRVLYRPYIYDYGWREEERIKQMLPCVNFNNTGTAVSIMKTCSLVVIDHPSTSFLEAFVINVPTILFWDNEQNPMREEAKPFFQLLVDAGILYYNPMDAAKKVNEISENPEIWWNSKYVQSAIQKFCRRFAWTSIDWRKMWVSTIKDLNSIN